MPTTSTSSTAGGHEAAAASAPIPPVDPAIQPPWPAPPVTPSSEPPPDTHLKPPEHVPAGQFAVKLKKGFTTFGLPYVSGDYYVGSHEDIAALIRQGYCDPPKTTSGAMSTTP